MITQNLFASSLLQEPQEVIQFLFKTYLAIEYLENLGFVDPTEQQIDLMEGLIGSKLNQFGWH